MKIAIDIFLNRLKIGQLQKLIDRYQIRMVYIPHLRKRTVMEKALIKYIKENGIGECPICFEPNRYMIAVTTLCAHIFCDKCLIEHLKKNHMCPMCRDPIDLLFIMNQISVYRMIKLRSTFKEIQECLEEVVNEPVNEVVINPIPLQPNIEENINTFSVMITATTAIYGLCIHSSLLCLCVMINICLSFIVFYQIYMFIYNIVL